MLNRLRVTTAGESHGPSLLAIIEGVPAGLALSREDIDRDLTRRQLGYGRGGRMKIEKDRAAVLSGVRLGRTIGSPVALLIENRDHENWRELMDAEARDDDVDHTSETRPRPGHGDLAGMLKIGTDDVRDVLERASARETAARVAAGAVARRLLEELGITVRSRVTAIGGVEASPDSNPTEVAFVRADDDPVRCTDTEASTLMVEEIDRAATEGDSLGGLFEVAAFGTVPGLGSYSQLDRRLDARLCGALASIPGVKGVEIGAGFSLGSVRGSAAHDEVFFGLERGLYRETNRAGGLEAGMANGETVLLRAVMKPIPTLAKPLATVDLATLEPATAFKERADVCAVPAAGVVGEAMVAIVLADAALEKFGGDSMVELKRNIDGYLQQISKYWKHN